jgi:hypothetical protein
VFSLADSNLPEISRLYREEVVNLLETTKDTDYTTYLDSVEYKEFGTLLVYHAANTKNLDKLVPQRIQSTLTKSKIFRTSISLTELHCLPKKERFSSKLLQEVKFLLQRTEYLIMFLLISAKILHQRIYRCLLVWLKAFIVCYYKTR